eukprot:CAMPEP_0174704800 /NCGR_PEP_ID=MMETSP1094-20130205/8251_1 /TAXON_ID=156173 /ORGANISM="Chrysochromulina brevifilum, Strain UTEX LB 985" /LENGTH=275 /DNA_ID=CAMNT_0015902887 /DNA_START=66 /DNA_END=894 /DNA_ORIENTATION=-
MRMLPLCVAWAQASALRIGLFPAHYRMPMVAPMMQAAPAEMASDDSGAETISVTVTREDGAKAFACGTFKVAAGAAAAADVAPAGTAPPAEEGPSPFELMDIRVGQIVEAWEHPDSEKLWCERIDVGEDEPREIASGLRAYYGTVEEMTGRKVLVVCNLKAAKLAGFASNGMVLCASSADRSTVAFVEPPEGSEPGERVLCEGAQLLAPASPNAVKKKKLMEKTANDLRAVDTVATYRGVPLVTAAGKCLSPTVSEGTINSAGLATSTYRVSRAA